MPRAEEVYPPELAEAERQLLKGRPAAVRMGGVGLALSGGGIRSATFGLGVMQALAREHLLHKVDYLSSVSGGGYVASFLGGLFTGPRAPSAPAPEDRSAEVERTLCEPHSFALHWLRQSGRYMSPTGSGDNLIAAAAYIRNWLAVQFVLASLALTALLATTGISLALRCLLEGGPALPAIPGASWSPLVLPALGTFALWSVPAGAAYWLTRALRRALLLVVVVTVVAALFFTTGTARTVAWALGAVAAVTLATSWVFKHKYADLRTLRRNLTAGLKLSFLVVAGLVAVAFIDGAGSRLFTALAQHELGWQALMAATGLSLPFALAQRFAPLLMGNGNGKKRVVLPRNLLAAVGALIVVAAILTGLQAVAYAIGLRTTTFPPACGGVRGCALLVTFLIGTAVCNLVSQSMGFLNLSSHQQLYCARLTRAYLGASNPLREQHAKSLVDPIPGDDISLADYRPWAHGGPLHLVNVTVNETHGGETQVEQRDRKGMNMAVGPAGISVGARHHALWADEARKTLRGVAPATGYRVFPGDGLEPEELSLGSWVAVSGAAFTTGLGSRTSLGLSVLLGLANVRLGHWWDTHCDPAARGAEPHLTAEQATWRRLSTWLPAHGSLLDELLARFYGPARRRWYLSDGGHFENTGVYELVRRRVPFIIACDSGCDPGYQWEDVGHLVRKARTDFGADIRFLDQVELEGKVPPAISSCFASPFAFTPFAGQRTDQPRPYAALAEVRWHDPEATGTLLLMKPTLRGDEPADVLTYWSGHEAFPHQTTFDQSFDEAQWESYRKLGEHAAASLFRSAATLEADPGLWLPHGLEPLAT